MKKQIFNPFLPLSEYIADGEPHVFGNRIYLFGSHDRENGSTYCMLDYVFWSAPIDDLTDWSNKGVSYSVTQDPRHSDKLKYMYAPDVVRGNDGRYYLYYCLSGERGVGGYGQPISVAVCDTPDGRYAYYGLVREPDGSPMLKYVTFDPAVINDDGTIRLYYGAWYPFHERGKLLDGIFYRIESRMFGKSAEEIASHPDGVMGANHVELADDMLTVKSPPVHIMPSQVKGTSFEQHPFFEGSSIRKIGNTYYFVYSSIHGHELCYATSQQPDRDFLFRGTIISNGDVGYRGRKEKDRTNATGTNHGSIVAIGENWYVFYHRNTNKTAYSRQACAEPIEICADGTIQQVEITSCGLNAGPLAGVGTYPAAICCNLTNGKMPHQGNGNIKKNVPYVTYRDGARIVVAASGTRITYKYFDFSGGDGAIRLRLRFGGGTIAVFFSDEERPSGRISFLDKKEWTDVRIPCRFPAGKHALSFVYTGKTAVELLEFEVLEKESE